MKGKTRRYGLSFYYKKEKDGLMFGAFFTGLLGSTIGLYVLMRSVSFYKRKGEREEHLAVRVLAVVSAVVAFCCIVAWTVSAIEQLNSL